MCDIQRANVQVHRFDVYVLSSFDTEILKTWPNLNNDMTIVDTLDSGVFKQTEISTNTEYWFILVRVLVQPD